VTDEHNGKTTETKEKTDTGRKLKLAEHRTEIVTYVYVRNKISKSQTS
jgi:hypothetical protein